MPQERHPTLYLTDGDIVLSASTPGTDTTQLFRVHRVYLSYSSEVFRDMFAMAAASASDGEYDGVPLLHLHDDAGDLASLLDVIYNASRLHELLTSCPKPYTPQRVFGLARIARKYMAQKIAQTIVEHVTKDWPKLVTDWDAYQTRRRTTPTSFQFPLWETGQINYPDEPVSAILLALDHDAIIPGALYRLLITPLDAEWESPASWYDWRADYLSARWSLLDRRNLMAVMRVRDGMHTKLKDTMEEMVQLADLKIDCYEFTCGVFWGGLRLWKRVYAEGCGAIDFLSIYNEDTFLEEDSGVCGECAYHFREALEVQRETLWDELSRLWKQHLQCTS